MRALAVLLFVAGIAHADAKKPNILLVMTDDQGYADFSCHGNPILKTPNLDRWHSQSLRLVDFHSAPVCTPTRGQIMTGQDAVRNGATSVTGGRACMRPGLATLPQLLRKLGYRTGIFGKWHLGDNYPHRPMDRGFDEAKYHLGWGMTAAPEFVGSYFDGRYFHNGAEKMFKGYMTDFWFDQAMAWMKERKGKDEPFFGYLPTNAPHGPHDVSAKYAAPYKETAKKAANFFGMIANVDENVGRLEAFLKDNGLWENTIVIFLTDNGGTTGVSVFNAGMRGGKTTFYEGGHRVPCWIRWPAGKLLPAGTDLNVPGQMQDLMPTLLELAGSSVPADVRIDGKSLAGCLRGSEKSPGDRMLVVQYSRAQLKKYESCVIWNHWRLVHGTELYDLKSDPAQKEDRAQKDPDIAKKLKDHYEKWWAEVEPLSKQFVPTYLGSDAQPSVELTSSDWQDIYSDNAGHVSQAVGGGRGAHWNVQVESAGTYEIAVRRWPRDLDLALTATLPRKDAVKQPIASAKLSIQGQELAAPAAENAKDVVFRVTLRKGSTRLQAWFQDKAGTDLCGAFYAYVRRVE